MPLKEQGGWRLYSPRAAEGRAGRPRDGCCSEEGREQRPLAALLSRARRTDGDSSGQGSPGASTAAKA